MSRRDAPRFDRSQLEPDLDAGLSAMGIELEPAVHRQLLDYLEALNRWNAAYNLTAIREPERMVPLHLLDSLALLPALGDARRLIDVGTGPGLPGVPLALARPQLAVTLLDSNGKKTRFLTQVIAQLGVDGCEVVKARAEDYRPVEPFDTVTCRAFAALPEIARLTGHLLAPGGRILAMKGRRPADELDALPRGWRAEVRHLEVPGVDGERHVVALSKEGDGA